MENCGARKEAAVKATINRFSGKTLSDLGVEEARFVLCDPVSRSPGIGRAPCDPDES
jgi:hypothetical protein